MDYLSKPINAEILRSKIGVFVELYRKTRALGELNEALQREIGRAGAGAGGAAAGEQELERRVQERTAALTRAHQGVRENEERLRMALDVAQIAAWEWHLASGRMTWSTDPEVLFGFPEGLVRPGAADLRAVHPDDKAVAEKALAAALETGVYEAEYRAVRPDGSVVWITERGRVVPDADGRPSGWSASAAT